MRRAACLSALLLLGLAGASCQKQAPENLAPSASALAPPVPAAAQAVTLQVDGASSQVKFLMEAAIEKISGEAPGSVEGALYLDREDISSSTGLARLVGAPRCTTA